MRLIPATIKAGVIEYAKSKNAVKDVSTNDIDIEDAPAPVKTEPNFKFLQAMDKEKKRVGEAKYYETMKVYGFEHSNQIVLREAQVAVYNALRGLNELAKQEPAQGEGNGA
jgi:hypothetical protein